MISFTFKSEKSQDSISLGADIQLKTQNDLKNVKWNIIKTFWSFEPSWEHSISCLMRSVKKYQYLGLSKEKKLIGYAIIIPKTGYIPQFGVVESERKRTYGKYLFQKLAKINNQLVVINVDNKSSETLNFLEKFGFTEYISQYEMKKDLIS